MSSDSNKALARRIPEEMWNTKNLDVIDDVYAPSPDGHQGTKQFVSAYMAAFPDLHSTILHQIAEANQMATRYTTKGTHLGPLADIPPTGEQSALEGSKHTALPMASWSRCGTVSIRRMRSSSFGRLRTEHLPVAGMSLV